MHRKIFLQFVKYCFNKYYETLMIDMRQYNKELRWKIEF
jgi:hypothetical protein